MNEWIDTTFRQLERKWTLEMQMFSTLSLFCFCFVFHPYQNLKTTYIKFKLSKLQITFNTYFFYSSIFLCSSYVHVLHFNSYSKIFMEILFEKSHESPEWTFVSVHPFLSAVSVWKNTYLSCFDLQCVQRGFRWRLMWSWVLGSCLHTETITSCGQRQDSALSLSKRLFFLKVAHPKCSCEGNVC